ncbi:MAG: VWA domain-containing protein [Planctomycetes bacterium]|nr:VWA domain-containing protein [Planctomycetota bacterium]
MEPAAHLLIVLPEGEVRVALTQETTSLGTSVGSTVVLRGDGIAERHCIIQRAEERYEVFDLFSPSGTLLNGARTEAQLLQHGDQLRIGTARLVFLQPTALTAANTAPPVALTTHVQDDVANAPATLEFEHSFVRSLGSVPFHACSVLLHVLLLLAFTRMAPKEQPQSRVPEFVSLTLESGTHAAAPPSEVVLDATAEPLAPITQSTLAELLSAQSTAPTSTTPQASLNTEATPGESSLTQLAQAAAGTGGSRSSGNTTTQPELGAPESLGLGLGLGLGSTGTDGGGGAGADAALRAGGSAFRQRVHALQGSGLDVVVVIDSTSSMSSVLDASRAAVGRIVSSIATLVPKFRLAVVTYRDEKDDYVTRHAAFGASPWTAVHFLEGVKPDGGGDSPEAVLEGLKTALQRLEWNSNSKRVILLVGDAPPHDEDLAAIHTLVSSYAARTTVHTLVTPHGGLSSRAGANPRTIETFASIAKAGKGVSKLLADANAVVPAMLSGAFGPDQDAAIQRAIVALDNSLAVRGARRLLERGELPALLETLQKDPPNAHVLRLLLEQPTVAFVPVYFFLLEDPKTPSAPRHAAAVLLRRALREARVSTAAQDLAAALDPKTGSSRLAGQVRELQRLIERDDRVVPTRMARRQ